MATRTYALHATPSGAAGSAGATVVQGLPAPGYIMGIAINYTSQPVTTDVTLDCIDPTGQTKNLVTRTNLNADVLLQQITEPLRDAAGVVLADTTKSPNVGPPMVAGTLLLTIAQGDPVADGVVMYVAVVFP